MHEAPISAVKNQPKRWFRGSKHHTGRSLSLGHQLALQLFCLVVAASVLFPIMWIFSMSLEGRDYQRPSTLQLLPSQVTFDAYQAVIEAPTSASSPVNFWRLFANSFFMASGVSFFSVLIGLSAAYAFSRFEFKGRQFLFLSVGFILLMPSIATLAPLFALLSRVQFSWTILQIVYFTLGGAIFIGSLLLAYARIRDDEFRADSIGIVALGLIVGSLLLYAGFQTDAGQKGLFSFRKSLYGVSFAMISGALPFAIWNLKGYLDTIPKELEEAAIIDGASSNQIFFRIILPLATPALAVTAFLGFMVGWTEFALSFQFITDQENYTLAMALRTMTGQYSTVPWSKFAAMSMMISLPVAIVYLLLQKYIIGGLTLGGVKG